MLIVYWTVIVLLLQLFQFSDISVKLVKSSTLGYIILYCHKLEKSL